MIFARIPIIEKTHTHILIRDQSHVHSAHPAHCPPIPAHKVPLCVWGCCVEREIIPCEFVNKVRFVYVRGLKYHDSCVSSHQDSLIRVRQFPAMVEQAPYSPALARLKLGLPTPSISSVYDANVSFDSKVIAGGFSDGSVIAWALNLHVRPFSVKV